MLNPLNTNRSISEKFYVKNGTTSVSKFLKVILLGSIMAKNGNNNSKRSKGLFVIWSRTSSFSFKIKKRLIILNLASKRTQHAH